jgi:hypothetical protein
VHSCFGVKVIVVAVASNSAVDPAAGIGTVAAGAIDSHADRAAQLRNLQFDLHPGYERNFHSLWSHNSHPGAGHNYLYLQIHHVQLAADHTGNSVADRNFARLQNCLGPVHCSRYFSGYDQPVPQLQNVAGKDGAYCYSLASNRHDTALFAESIVGFEMLHAVCSSMPCNSPSSKIVHKSLVQNCHLSHF